MYKINMQNNLTNVNMLYVAYFFLNSQHWTKIEQGVGEPWPEARSAHADCCLGHGGEHPQILITGGVNNDYEPLADAWLFDVLSRKWKKVRSINTNKLTHTHIERYKPCKHVVTTKIVTLILQFNNCYNVPLIRIANIT